MGTDDPTTVQMLENPENAESIMLRANVLNIKKLEIEFAEIKVDIEEIKRFQQPFRSFAKILLATMGTAAAIAMTAWIGFGG